MNHMDKTEKEELNC